MSVFVRSLGVITPAGRGLDVLWQRIELGPPCFSPASQFDLPPDRATLVGAVPDELLPWGGLPEEDLPEAVLPRAHCIALVAAREATLGLRSPPDAVVLGITTGGLSATEKALRRDDASPRAYSFHGLDTVTSVVAEAVGCRGFQLTLSTACSSGAVALAVGRELIRAGLARRVLAGGVDSLCQLTVQGFSLLRVCDPQGCRPLDAERRGMTVAEGAAFLVLDAKARPASGNVALVGTGLSCDAHHATAPDPLGRGAAQAMRAALEDAGLVSDRVGYLNLHGTGTRDNDAAEARALRDVFGESMPRVSSTKGAVGHALAASGAIEAALAVSVLQSGRIPPNPGLVRADPDLGLTPIQEPLRAQVDVVQSNSLGFGGNNASLVFGTRSALEPHSRLSCGPSAALGYYPPGFACRSQITPEAPQVRRPAREARRGVRGPRGDSLAAGERGGAPLQQSGIARPPHSRLSCGPSAALWVMAAGAVTGAGTLDATWDALRAGQGLSPRLTDGALAEILAGIPLRRLGRLTQLALAATVDAASKVDVVPAASAASTAPAASLGSPARSVSSIFFGTGWGAVRETYDFLHRLWESEGAFSSPALFSSAVHNAVAGQLAIHWGARGANLTAVGRQDAMAQAALVASIVKAPQPSWLVVADEWHPVLSPRLNGSRGHGAREADGAAALLVSTEASPEAVARLEVVELSGVLLRAAAVGGMDAFDAAMDSRDAIAGSCDAVLDVRAAAPDVRDAVPDARDAVLDVRAAAPDVRDAVPDARAAAPDVRAAAPDARRDLGREMDALLPTVLVSDHLAAHGSLLGQGLALAVRALGEGALPAGMLQAGSMPAGLTSAGELALGRRRLLVLGQGCAILVSAP